MALLWGDFRNQIRRSFLKDTASANYRWSNEELADYCGWALDTLCAHTAVATGVTYQDASDGPFTLPDNLYDNLETTGEVSVLEGTRPVYLDPIRRTEALSRNSTRGFYVWPDKTLNINYGSSGVLSVNYFAYYNHPLADDDDMSAVPTKLVSALGYLIAAHALSGYYMRTGNIRQWNQRPDTGTPEDNPLMMVSNNFLKMYEWQLRQHTPQDRPNFFREAR